MDQSGVTESLTVLVVDDDPDVRLIARLVLSAAGHDVIEVESGEAALEAIDHEDGRPDVVLLDVRMPGIDGWEVLRRLRGDPGRGRVPVVVFTADVAARSEAPPEIGSSALLTKPFHTDELLEAIGAAAGAARRGDR